MDFEKLFTENMCPEFRLRKRTYIACPFSFDIEVTSTYTKDGLKIAFPYIEMFGINHTFHYTRYLSDCIAMFDKLSDYLEKEDKYIICLVHNLSYEFMFLNKFIQFSDVFARKKYKVMKATYRRIEFRCSMLLSNMSLDLLASRFCRTQKKKGDLDYIKVRYPETRLSRIEIGYCRNDVIILNEYFEYLYKEYVEGKKVVFFPLTSTSVVRHYCKSLIENENEYHKKLKQIAPSNYLFTMLMQAFMGGYVHGNVINAFIEIPDVTSFDKKSSYPAVLFSEKFPMTAFKRLQATDFDYYYKKRNEYAMLFCVHFKNIKVRGTISTISSSKCIGHSKNWVLDNGRVWKAEYVSMVITEKDLEIIQEYYSCESFFVEELHVSKKKYLPKFLLDAVVNLFFEKEELGRKRDSYIDADGNITNEEKFDYYDKLYQKKKNEFNALYGMMVTNNSKDSHEYRDGKWCPTVGHYQFKRNDFLVFQWGVWCTAYARYNLLHNMGKIGDDFCYSDTDSRKIKNAEKYLKLIEEENAIQREKIRKTCETFGYDFEKLKVLGQWENEGTAHRFKHLGAKRYCADEKPTCSGLSKKAFKARSKKEGISIFDLFKNGMVFDENDSMKNTSCYVETNKPYEYEYEFAGQKKKLLIGDFIHIKPTSFILKAGNIYETFKENCIEILQSDFS